MSHLTFLQLDPTAAIAPSADLVAWTRLGDAVPAGAVRRTGLERDRTLYELARYIRPTADLGLYLEAGGLAVCEDEAVLDAARTGRAWLAANDPFRRDVLALLREAGPLMSRDVPDTSVVPWPSTGWTNNRNVTQMLEFLAARGEVAISGRSGRQRLWDLAERVYPDSRPCRRTRRRAARRAPARRWLGSPGRVSRWSGPLGVAGEPAEVEGTGASGGSTRPARQAVRRPHGAAVAVRPAGPRPRPAQELFDFEYVLEMYKPKAKRRWGYFALPCCTATGSSERSTRPADQKACGLRVHAIHEDVPFTRALTKAVRARRSTALASWLGLEDVALDDT